jgi:hypothetical protein
MWEAIFNWSELVKFGGDVVTYFILAAVGTLLFLIRLVLALFGSDGSDFDVDADVGTDASFTLFSLLSVMAFVMGTGWMGLACRVDWDLNRPLSAVVAISFGVVMMLLASGTMYLIRKLNREVSYDVSTAVGKTARVYMKIPAKGKGQGKVQVSVSGRLKTIQAVSSSKEIPAFADVTVVDTRDDETLIVKPLE